MIVKEIKFQAMRLCLLLILGFLFMACPDVEEDPDIVSPVSNTQFMFHQDINKLYFEKAVGKNGRISREYLKRQQEYILKLYNPPE